MQISELQFPVLTVANGMIQSAKDMDELTACSPGGLKSGAFRGMKIIDSNGKAVKVVDARKAGYRGPFFGFRLFLPRRLRADLSLGPMLGVVSLEELKAELKAQFRKDRSWEACGSLQELDEVVTRSNSREELINLGIWKPDPRLL